MKDMLLINHGLVLRMIAGVTIFLILAVVDLRKNGRSARRWREYTFLIFCVIVAMLYGALNDQVTSRISWEYFYYGKELSQTLGPDTPPEPAALHWAAAKVGMGATWSAGLIIGVALLIANNPRRGLPSLRYPRLALELAVVFAITIATSILGGLLGSRGLLNFLGEDFRGIWQTNLWRPSHFMTTWGVHLGGYVGGLLGTIVATVRAVQKRKFCRRVAESAETDAENV